MNIKRLATEKKFLEKKNVVAVGQGYKEVGGKRTESMAIICSVIKKEPLAKLKKKDIIPQLVKGVPTDVKVVGVIKALKLRTDKWRPAPGGVSVGHEWITAGTLGCLVKKNSEIFILSNNHVLADSNNAPLGSPILQPGKYDGGELIDRIATLEDFVPIEFGGQPSECKVGKGVAGVTNFFAQMIGSQTRFKSVSIRPILNRVDAAIAKPVEESMVLNEILEIGEVSGVGKGTLGMKVKKSGRTTQVTEGEITQINVMVNVQYGEGQIAIFMDQLMITPGNFSAGGDSGSVVLDEENKIVALLFAGGDEGTVVSPIEFVFEDLGVYL